MFTLISTKALATLAGAALVGGGTSVALGHGTDTTSTATPGSVTLSGACTGTSGTGTTTSSTGGPLLFTLPHAVTGVGTGAGDGSLVTVGGNDGGGTVTVLPGSPTGTPSTPPSTPSTPSASTSGGRPLIDVDLLNGSSADGRLLGVDLADGSGLLGADLRHTDLLDVDGPTGH